MIIHNLQYIGHCTECSAACYFAFHNKKPIICETCKCNAILAKGHPLLVTPVWFLRLVLMLIFAVAYYETQAIGVLAFPTVIFLFQLTWYFNDIHPDIYGTDIVKQTELNFPTTFVDYNSKETSHDRL